MATTAPAYEMRRASRDGTGKFYMGREIAKVMTYHGAPWLERAERTKEERPDLVLAAFELKQGMAVADIGAGAGWFTNYEASAYPNGDTVHNYANSGTYDITIVQHWTATWSIGTQTGGSITGPSSQQGLTGLVRTGTEVTGAEWVESDNRWRVQARSTDGTASTYDADVLVLATGFDPAEIVVSPPRLEDRWAYAYGDNRPPERFRYSNTVSLRTIKVDKALEALRSSGQLVARGVMIDQGSQPEFDYTRLNDIKPALIAEATAAARESAVQFAKDSGSKLGGIRNANQGVVSISDRDQSSPQVKKVRVVTTVEYFLRD